MQKQKLSVLLAAALFCGMIFSSPATGAENGAIEILRETGRAFTLVADKAVPGVVSIRTETTVKVSKSPFEDEFFEHFFGPQFRRGPQERKRQGQGSGFIISKDGYVMTNTHVVKDADKITVVLKDGRELIAELIGTSEETDVAVIKIEGKDFPVVELGNSDDLQIGEWAIAVGNPFGLEATVTVGVISAKGRKFTVTEEGYGDFIQTDAAINPGNSGGPLLDIDGKAIGINTLIISRSGGYMGIGFAIPINMAKSVKDQLIETGKVEFGFLGIRMEDISEELAKYYDLKQAKGVIVSQVVKDSAAEKAGLKEDDIITKVNGRDVEDAMSFRNSIAFMPPGTKVKLTIIRDGKEKVLTAKLTAKKKGNGTSENAQKFGLEVEEITEEKAQKLNTKAGRGVAISKIMDGKSAEENGLRTDMVILSVNGIEVNTIEEFNKAVELRMDDKMVQLRIKQGRYSVRVILSLDN
jgi:serine protease Do